MFWAYVIGRIINWIGTALILVPLIQFAYHYPSFIDRQKRESALVFVLTILINITVIGLNLYKLIFLEILQGSYKLLILSTTVPLILFIPQFLWAIVVLFRKSVVLEKDAAAARSIALILLIPFVLVLIDLLYQVDILSHFLATFTTEIGLLVFFFVFVVTYLNHTAEPITFQIKLIGGTLVTMVAIVGTLACFIGPFFERDYGNENRVRENQTIHFEPNKRGSYTISRAPLRYDSELGQRIKLQPDDILPYVSQNTVDLEFAFPFFDHVYESIQVLSVPWISLGPASVRGNWASMHPTPFIAPLLTFHGNGGGEVFHKQEEGRTIITWTGSNTVQLVLFQDGSFDIAYRKLHISGVYSIFQVQSSAILLGIHPGGRHSTGEMIRFEEDLPHTGLSRGYILESYEDDFRQYLNRRLMPFVIVLVIGALFMILIFPVLFRANLVKPLYALLGGMKQVDEGVLDVELSPRFNDEIGFLTQSFNRMVYSIKRTDQLKNDFLANTSHELRTPLNGIIGIAESLIDGAAGEINESMHSNLSLVVSSGKRLSNLVNDILDLSRLKHAGIRLNLTAVDMREITELVFALSQSLLAGKSLELRNEIPPDLPDVKGDEARIEQVMLNLVANAIKFTDSGTVRVTGHSENGKVTISVIDTGIGIPNERINDIFKAFEQVDSSVVREYGGAGLGLNITKQLVEAHGGTIRVESQPGTGSNFLFTLPRSEESQPRIRIDKDEVSKIREVADTLVSSSPPGPSLTGSFKILVVDDEAVNQRVLANQLTLLDFSVAQAMNGPEALRFIEEEHFDLVLLDIMMPRMSGYEVCRKIRERHPPNELPVIMLTAKNLVSDLVYGMESGANDYLAKPVSKDELIARIKINLNLAKINIAYGRFVPRDFLRLLKKESIVDVRLGDQIQKQMTILFSDIRSFTSLSETMTPEQNSPSSTHI